MNQVENGVWGLEGPTHVMTQPVKRNWFILTVLTSELEEKEMKLVIS